MPTFRVDTPIAVKSLWKHSHRHAQRRVSYMGLDLIKSTMKMDPHHKQECIRQIITSCALYCVDSGAVQVRKEYTAGNIHLIQSL